MVITFGTISFDTDTGVVTQQLGGWGEPNQYIEIYNSNKDNNEKLVEVLQIVFNEGKKIKENEINSALMVRELIRR